MQKADANGGHDEFNLSTLHSLPPRLHPDMPNLDDLPVDVSLSPSSWHALTLPRQILYEIHDISLSEHLPSVNRYLYAVLSHPTTTRAAHWLIKRYFSAHGARGFLARALECPVCDLEVLREIERIWEREVAEAQVGKRTRWFGLSRRDEGDPEPTLICSTLPRRIFRHPRATADALCSPVPPILKHLFERYQPLPNSHRGYPLSRAVLHADIPLIEFLRTHGADPKEKDYLAVEIALTRRDIRMLRLLIDGPGEGDASVTETVDVGGRGKRKRTGDDGRAGSSKRAKTTISATTTASSRTSKVVPVRLTQPLVDAALVKGTPEIIQYIVQEKGTCRVVC